MTSAFRGSPYKALEIEASILLPEVRFERLYNQYAIQSLVFNKAYPIYQLLSLTTTNELDDTPYLFSSSIRLLLPTIQLFNYIRRIEGIGFRNRLEIVYSDLKP